MKRRSAVIALTTLALGTGAVRFAMAQSSNVSGFPSRPVHLVLGFPPGGAGDVIGRSLGDAAARELGQPVVVENRPGAATNIASTHVARSDPDGHTLLLGGSFSHAVNPALFASLPFDPVKDFTPICKVATAPTVFAVPASLPVSTLEEFIALARREGDKFSYGSSGIGSPGHIAGAYFNARTGLSMTHVPYKGASESVRDLIAGDLQMIIASPAAVMPIVAQGRAKALALTTPGRSRVVPGVPGSDEAGLADFNFDGWFGVFAAGNTPPAIASRLHDAFVVGLNEPATVARLESMGIAPDPSESPQAFERYVRDSAVYWEKIVRQTGIKL